MFLQRKPRIAVIMGEDSGRLFEKRGLGAQNRGITVCVGAHRFPPVCQKYQERVRRGRPLRPPGPGGATLPWGVKICPARDQPEENFLAKF